MIAASKQTRDNSAIKGFLICPFLSAGCVPVPIADWAFNATGTQGTVTIEGFIPWRQTGLTEKNTRRNPVHLCGRKIRLYCP